MPREGKEHSQDVAEHRWGLRFHGYFQTGTEEFVLPDGEGTTFVPRTRAMLLSTEKAIILAFRGSEPTNLINLRSAGRRALVVGSRCCQLSKHMSIPKKLGGFLCPCGS